MIPLYSITWRFWAQVGWRFLGVWFPDWFIILILHVENVSADVYSIIIIDLVNPYIWNEAPASEKVNILYWVFYAAL